MKQNLSTQKKYVLRNSVFRKMLFLSSILLFVAVLFISILASANIKGLPLLLFAMIIAAILILINISAFRVWIINPINKISKVLQKAEKGNIDQQIRLWSEDEISEIAAHIDKTLDNLKRMVMIIQNEAESLDDIGLDLTANMEKTAQAISEINSAVKNMQVKAKAQSESVDTTNAAMERITENISRLSDDIEIQSNSVSQSSSAIEKMLTNIDSVTRITRTNSENVARLAGASEVGRAGLVAVAKNMQEIARESEGLMEINAVLQNIARQTNLLAMNAAIEAAHAGMAGRGFAVVADEIRQLAESSGAQSKAIGTELKKMRDSMTGISDATGKVLEKFALIDADVKTVSDQEQQILNAMEEQNTGSRQILEVIKKLNEITITVKKNSAEMREGSREVIKEGKNLINAAEEISAELNDMSSRAGEVNSSVNHTNNISRKNKGNIDVLREAISRYVVPEELRYTWNDYMAVGVEKIDEQHKQLFLAISGFINAIEKGAGKEELKKSLDFLYSYTLNHFAEEEIFQRECGFPECERHHALHEKFKQVIMELVEEFANFGTSETLARQVKRKIGDWLVTHVRGEDSKLGAHLSRSKFRKR
ncbi:MAG: bacteriohemerythrin [Spirochaetes bacterium]|nr:bacteriohemerythrin [Spirochaetota bacterium]